MEASPASVVGSSEHSINPCSVLDQPAAVDLIDLSSGVSAEDLSPTDHSETSTTFSHAQSLIVSPSASCPTKPTKHQGVAPIPIYSGFRIGAEVELLECEYSPTLEGHRMSLKVSTSDVRRIAEAFVLRKINRPHENVHLYLIGVTLDILGSEACMKRAVLLYTL
ncbi:unnamed protein product [Protopolystoma xenopodis]|uniref:Uncharacterized protein n=1 Tax=Protopolystoma xenopodis TaxID=117903 RepID=A0A448XF76_9PLAT|nr:unnamed protein product [Protopolystoma xenopodis]